MRIREQSRVKSEENVSLALKALRLARLLQTFRVRLPHSKPVPRPEALSSPAETGSRGLRKASEADALPPGQTLANGQHFPSRGFRGQAPAGRYVA